MHNPSTPRGPWSLLIFDRDREDPKWILATVTSPADVRPAGANETAQPDDLTMSWACGRRGRLTALPGALAWRVDR
jgi:hypothetical protein